MPKVSIILPSYNYENYVSETIDSVLAQTYTDWELVIVDDGSSDRSPEIIERYAQQYPDRIRVFYHAGRVNRGLAQTYREGLAHSTGDYVAFIESDDRWFPDNLSKKIDVLDRRPDVAAVYSRVKMFGDDVSIQNLKKKYYWPRYIAAGLGDTTFNAIDYILNFNFTLTFSNYITRRGLLDDLNDDPPRGAWLDWWWLSQIALKGFFYYVPDVCVCWRIHRKSQNYSLLSKIDNFTESFRMQDQIQRLLRRRLSEFPDQTPRAMREGILNAIESKRNRRWIELAEVGFKWFLRKNLPSLWYEYLRNIFVNTNNKRILSCVDSPNGAISGCVFRLDGRPIVLVEVYSGWEFLSGASPTEYRPDMARKYPELTHVAKSGYQFPVTEDWSRRKKIFYLIAWQAGGRWKKIAELCLDHSPASLKKRLKDIASFLLLIKEIERRKRTVKPYRNVSPRMKILISGLSKSGTTALYSKIKNSMGSSTRCLFEPKIFKPESEDSQRAVLAKIIIGGARETDFESFRGFERKIWIVRDPRDRIVSSTLYSLYHAAFLNDARKMAQFLDLLRLKEKNPRTVSLTEIIRLRAELNDADPNAWLLFIRKRYEIGLDYHAHRPDLHVIRYEDFVDGRIKELESYLGFRLYGNAQVDKELKRVVRTCSYGDWKNWFLEEDVELFRPIFSEWMRRYGYSDDWRLPESPAPDPRFGSQYVETLFKESSSRIVEKVIL